MLFVSGCDIHCEGCHNPSTWDIDSGEDMSLDEIKEKILEYMPPVDGVTFCGGEPTMQMEDVRELAYWAKKKGLRTTLYTGHRIEEIHLSYDEPFDYIIDGAFVLNKKTGDCAFRGSSNQRIWKKHGDCYGLIEISDKGEEVWVGEEQA